MTEATSLVRLTATHARLWQQFVTVAGMVAVITAVLSGSASGLLAAVISGHSLVAALVVGVVVAAAALTGLMRYQNSAWTGAHRRFPAQKQSRIVPKLPKRTERQWLIKCANLGPGRVSARS
jgi:hypothetical protein